MIRGLIAGVAVAILSMTALFAINFALTQISPEHYRRVVLQALESGTLGTVTHLPFAPGKDIYPFGGNDCLILGALVMPRDAPLKASVSPRLPLSGDEIDSAQPDRPVPAAVVLSSIHSRRYYSRGAAAGGHVFCHSHDDPACCMLRNDCGDRAAGAVSVHD